MQLLNFEAADVLKTQVKMVEEITETHTLIKWGKIILEEKKVEEAAAIAAVGPSSMSAAEALIAGNASKKQRKK